MTLGGLLIAAVACATTLCVISLAALAVITLRIHEERRGNGCRDGGCRRRRPGNGCSIELRGAESARGDTHWRE
jgi:hypothetical protein